MGWALGLAFLHLNLSNLWEHCLSCILSSVSRTRLLLNAEPAHSNSSPTNPKPWWRLMVVKALDWNEPLFYGPANTSTEPKTREVEDKNRKPDVSNLSWLFSRASSREE